VKLHEVMEHLFGRQNCPSCASVPCWPKAAPSGWNWRERREESLGDREGAAVTRHNLNLLGGSGGDNEPEGNGGGGGAASPALWPLIVGTIGVVGMSGLEKHTGDVGEHGILCRLIHSRGMYRGLLRTGPPRRVHRRPVRPERAKGETC
jgi:hypothetical protein